jgi:hypothetical protein
LSEVIEIYFELAYRIIGRIIYGEKFSEQTTVPLYIKAIAAFFPVVVLAFLAWLVIELNN